MQQAGGLETHRFTSGVRSRDDENVLFGSQHDVERHDAPPVLFLKMLLKQRVARSDEVDIRRSFHLRLKAVHRPRHTRLSLDEVDLSQELIGVEHLANMGSDALRHLRQDADNLLTLLAFKFTDLVVGFHHFRGFNINRAARSALVVNNTRDLSFQSRSHRNDETPVAHSRSGILVHDTLALCRVEDTVEDT